VLEGHTGPVFAVAFSPDGQLLASGSYDHTVRLWNPATGKELQKLEGHTDLVQTVAFSPDGQLLASGSYDHTVRLWNPATGKELQKLKVDGVVTMMSFSSNGPFLETNKGFLKVKFYMPPTSSSQTDTITEAIVQNHWITRNSENLVWLPPEYRPACSAFQDNILALGCLSGMVEFIEFG
jgi:WD40 repeat protein